MVHVVEVSSGWRYLRHPMVDLSAFPGQGLRKEMAVQWERKFGEAMPEGATIETTPEGDYWENQE